jgi:serine/threonine-protein kinase
VSRFVAEARAVNQIKHRNIIDIFGFSTLDDGRHYYVMEHLDGQGLDQRLAEGPIPLAEAVPILRGIARALDAAHAKGIAHRDLKPANIFLATEVDGSVFPKLLDFGIAKLFAQADGPAMHKTRTGSPMGTPFYMSPEQARGRPVDHRTDIYALGIVAFEIVTGRVPFPGVEYMEILWSQINDPAPDASSINRALPAAIDRPIAAMLQKEPAARPASCAAAIAGLEAAVTAAGVALPPDPYAKAPSGQGAATPTPSTPGGATPGLAARLAAASAERQSGRGAGADIAQAATLDAAPTPPPAAETATGGRRWLVPVIAGTTLVLAAFGWLVVMPMLDDEAAVKREPVAAATVDAGSGSGTGTGSAEPTPPWVTITLEGPPRGTEVYGPSGALLGVAPGAIQLPRGTAPLIVTLKADGHVTASTPIVPDQDRTVPITLEPKPGVRPRPRPRPGGGSGSETGAGTGSGRNDTLPPDPFKKDRL